MIKRLQAEKLLHLLVERVQFLLAKKLLRLLVERVQCLQVEKLLRPLVEKVQCLLATKHLLPLVEKVQYQLEENNRLAKRNPLQVKKNLAVEGRKSRETFWINWHGQDVIKERHG